MWSILKVKKNLKKTCLHSPMYFIWNTFYYLSILWKTISTSSCLHNLLLLHYSLQITLNNIKFTINLNNYSKGNKLCHNSSITLRILSWNEMNNHNLSLCELNSFISISLYISTFFIWIMTFLELIIWI